MSRRTVLAFVLLLLLSGVCQGSEKIVTLATLTDFAPFCFPRENPVRAEVEILPPGADSGQLQGYSWDVVRESFHAMEYTIRLYVVPWERGMHYLSVGKVQAIFPANHNAERDLVYAFSKAFVDQVLMVVYMRADSPLEWRGLQSIDGLSIGFVRGWSYGKEWEAAAGIKKEPTDTISQGFDLIANGRLAGIVGYQLPYHHELKKTGRLDEFRIVGHFDTVNEYLMGRKNDRPSLLQLDVFDSGRKKIEENGVFADIERKWR